MMSVMQSCLSIVWCCVSVKKCSNFLFIKWKLDTNLYFPFLHQHCFCSCQLSFSTYLLRNDWCRCHYKLLFVDFAQFSFYAIHRLRSNFDNPEQFWPERFSAENTKYVNFISIYIDKFLSHFQFFGRLGVMGL